MQVHVIYIFNLLQIVIINNISIFFPLFQLLLLNNNIGIRLAVIIRIVRIFLYCLYFYSDTKIEKANNIPLYVSIMYIYFITIIYNDLS